MQHKLQRRGQRGAVIFLIFNFIVFTFLMMWVGIFLGQMQTRKDEMQSAADAVTVTIAQIARTGGIAAVCNNPALDYVLRNNIGGNPNNPQWEMRIATPCDQLVTVVDDGEGAERLQINAQLIARQAPPDPIFGRMLGFEDDVVLNSRSIVDLPQSNLRDVERKLPRMVLALDFSGSMDAEYGGGLKRYEALQEAVDALLDVDNIEFGAVLFDDGVISFVDEISDHPADRDVIADMVFGQGPEGGTNYEAPLRRATDLLRADDGPGKGYILLVSDGDPNEGDYMRGAEAAWRAGYTIITLSVRQPGQAPLPAMIDVAGEPGNGGDRNLALVATNAAELQAIFRNIAGELLCRLGPINPEPDVGEQVFAFLVDRFGTETPLERYDGLPGVRSHARDMGFAHLGDENKVMLTAAACEEVLDSGAHVIVRLSQQALVQ